ncbi:Two-component hybrid sensor and regulator [uncultured Defluviicoccus sp.]|uniref:histidine kinase n=1 Tax=metagenome TaxID=256318 RepID=A0A380T7K9_9ZZZZ|nr:Two-component hybrid sensor and regulator [uncultured Defluviicoccus sp.]
MTGRDLAGPRLVGLRRASLVWLGGAAVIGAVTALAVALGLSFATASLAYLTTIVVLSLFTPLAAAIVFSVLAVIGLNYFFLEPLFTFQIKSSQDFWALGAFIVAALVITTLVGRIHASAAEKRAAEDVLERSKAAYLDEAQRLSQTGSFGWNIATGELQWSDETFRICGIDRATPLSIDLINQRVHADDATAFREAVQAAVKSRGAFDHELRFTRDGGDVRVLHMKGHFLKEQPEQFVGALIDITDRRRNEEALQNSEFRYRNIFRAMSVSFWELDFSEVGAMLRALRKSGVQDFAAHFAEHPEFVRDMMRATRVLDVNDYAVMLQGRGDKGALLGNVEPLWPETSNAVYAASVIAAITGKPGFSAETRMRKIDGTEFPAHFTASFPKEGVASARLLIGVIDISERVAAQEKLRAVQAEFAHAARLSTLGELAASIAHEVNQPLAAIATNASAGLRWLDRPEPNLEEVRALAARIAGDAKRAGDIIARIRSMAARRATESTPLSVKSVIEEAASFLRHDLQAQQVTLQLSLPPDLPPVLGDRTQLQQVVVNLAINAAQAMAQSGAEKRRITISAARQEGGILITVDDTGPGIPPEHVDRLFESFFTTKEAGMGIGLPICKSIVEAHGGQIEAENRATGGARFSFTLPAHEAA